MSLPKRLFKSIYPYVPLKKAGYSMLRRIAKPSQRVYQHLHFKGFFKVEAAPGKSFRIWHHGAIEENEIFWNGLYHGWEKKSMELWSKLVPDAKFILDIGANTGIYGLVAETLNPQATVHCFEPIKGVFTILEKNFRRNAFNGKVHELALSNYTGEAKIYLAKGDDFAYSVTINKNTLKVASDEVTVKVKTLAEFIREENLTQIDLMKIDVESHEPEVLEGMGHFLADFRPTILIEVLDDATGEQLSTIFDGLGYLYFSIDDEKGTVRQTQEIRKSDYWNYLVCNEETARRLQLI